MLTWFVDIIIYFRTKFSLLKYLRHIIGRFIGLIKSKLCSYIQVFLHKHVNSLLLQNEYENIQK